MNKRELVADVAARTGNDPAEIAKVVDALVDVVVRSVAAGDRVVIQDFGVFVRQARARRVARDLTTGEAVTVAATHVPAFRAGKAFRELVAAPRRRRTAALTGRRRQTVGRPQSSTGGRSGAPRRKTGSDRSSSRSRA
jgi:DNA-binding protein HU-beta